MAFVSLYTPDQARLSGQGVWELVLTNWGETDAAVDPAGLSYGQWPTRFFGTVGMPAGNPLQQLLPPSVALSMAPRSTADQIFFYSFPPATPGLQDPSPVTNANANRMINKMSRERPWLGQLESPLWLICPSERQYTDTYQVFDSPAQVNFKTRLLRPELRINFHLRNPPYPPTYRAPLLDSNGLDINAVGYRDYRIWPVAGRKNIRLAVEADIACNVRVTAIAHIGGQTSILKEYLLAGGGPTAIAGIGGSTVFNFNGQEITWLVLKGERAGALQLRWSLEAAD